jgi:ligand-binding SRPBCC domain-containing protein
MKEHIFRSELLLPKSPSEIFPFFANARNLETITPPWVRFEIVTKGVVEMRVGALIDYKISIHGIPMKWRTKITAWDPPHRFVDEQIKGPYRQWIHEHVFEESPDGSLCTDRVHYSVLGGSLVNFLFVKRDVQRIFEYRNATLSRVLGKS